MVLQHCCPELAGNKEKFEANLVLARSNVSALIAERDTTIPRYFAAAFINSSFSTLLIRLIAYSRFNASERVSAISW